jgi:predicted flap endonuclease-1-like 5' DNA nuclease
MSNNQTDKSCRTNSWLAAVVLGILGFLLAWRWLDWGVLTSIVLGAVVFFIVGYLMVSLLCGKTESAQAAPLAPAPKTSSTPQPAPESVPEPVPEPAPEPAKPAAPVEPEKAPTPEMSEPQKPAGLDAPRGGNADDLKKISGIGPGLEKSLNENGIYHYDQIAGWTASDVAYVDEHMLRFKGRATRDEWVKQAAKLAAGGDS